MRTLADEIVDTVAGMVAAHPDGVTARQLSARLGVAYGKVMEILDGLRAPTAEARRLVFAIHPRAEGQRGALPTYLLPVGYQLPAPTGVHRRACLHCYAVFEVRSDLKRRCCSRTCSIAWSWTRPGVTERRGRAIRAAKDTPEYRAKQAAHSKRRWSNPEERRRQSERNKKQWANPVQRAKRSAAIQRANGSPEARRKLSERRRAEWADPEQRERRRAIMREAHNRPERKAALAERMRAAWRDPVMRAKYLATKAEQAAKIAAKNRGRKQKPEHVAKRVAAQKAACAARGPIKQTPEQITDRVQKVKATWARKRAAKVKA